eukprot:TRINITY_DN4023_c0_g1_i5.p1 TRINITY_DN4023_c0_g1~~TRINITY_DN4023_c0_g1_i5.p1  ORF type:complete len:2876 (-),score=422.32 TRINITY_DN4023_c0_g1_i5:253-8880(-)
MRDSSFDVHKRLQVHEHASVDLKDVLSPKTMSSVGMVPKRAGRQPQQWNSRFSGMQQLASRHATEARALRQSQQQQQHQQSQPQQQQQQQQQQTQPHQQQNQQQSSSQQVKGRESEPERRKRLGLVGIPRVSDAKGSNGLGPTAPPASRTDVVGDIDEPVQRNSPRGPRDVVEETLRDSVQTEGLAAPGAVVDGRRTRMTGWYNSERAQELVKSIQSETAHTRRIQEEKDKKRQEQLRRLENVYRSQRPASAVASASAAKPKAQSPPPQQRLTLARQPQQSPPASQSHLAQNSASTASADVWKPSGQRQSNRHIARRSRVVRARVGRRRPHSAGPTVRPTGAPWIGSSQKPRDSIEEVLPTESDDALTEPEAAHYTRMSWARSCSTEELRGRLAASLSDSGEPHDGGHGLGGVSGGGVGFRPARRLAARIRAATLERARHMRDSMHQDCLSQDPHAPYGPFMQEWPEPCAQKSEHAWTEGSDPSFEGAHPVDLHPQHSEPWQAESLPWQRPVVPQDSVPWPPCLPVDEDDDVFSVDQASAQQTADGRRERVSDDFDAAEQRSYLTAQDRLRIDEVVAEQRRLRNRDIPEVGGMRFFPEGSLTQGSGMRPPSRGGESWQPLGQTNPLAYEEVTPELFEQYQQLMPSRGPPSVSQGGENEESSQASQDIPLRDVFDFHDDALARAAPDHHAHGSHNLDQRFNDVRSGYHSQLAARRWAEVPEHHSQSGSAVSVEISAGEAPVPHEQWWNGVEPRRAAALLGYALAGEGQASSFSSAVGPLRVAAEDDVGGCLERGVVSEVDGPALGATVTQAEEPTDVQFGSEEIDVPFQRPAEQLSPSNSDHLIKTRLPWRPSMSPSSAQMTLEEEDRARGNEGSCEGLEFSEYQESGADVIAGVSTPVVSPQPDGGLVASAFRSPGTGTAVYRGGSMGSSTSAAMNAVASVSADDAPPQDFMDAIMDRLEIPMAKATPAHRPHSKQTLDSLSRESLEEEQSRARLEAEQLELELLAKENSRLEQERERRADRDRIDRDRRELELDRERLSKELEIERDRSERDRLDRERTERDRLGLEQDLWDRDRASERQPDVEREERLQTMGGAGTDKSFEKVDELVQLEKHESKHEQRSPFGEHENDRDRSREARTDAGLSCSGVGFADNSGLNDKIVLVDQTSRSDAEVSSKWDRVGEGESASKHVSESGKSRSSANTAVEFGSVDSREDNNLRTNKTPLGPHVRVHDSDDVERATSPSFLLASCDAADGSLRSAQTSGVAQVRGFADGGDTEAVAEKNMPYPSMTGNPPSMNASAPSPEIRQVDTVASDAASVGKPAVKESVRDSDVQADAGEAPKKSRSNGNTSTTSNPLRIARVSAAVAATHSSSSAWVPGSFGAHPWDVDTSSSTSHDEPVGGTIAAVSAHLKEHRADSEDAASSATDAGSALLDPTCAELQTVVASGDASDPRIASDSVGRRRTPEANDVAGRLAPVGRTPHSEEEGDVSSGTSASNAWLGSPERSEGTALKHMMWHSKHKHMIRKLIPSFPSPEEPPTYKDSALSSTRSLESNSSSSSAAASNDRVLESDRFTRFTCDLAKRIDKEEEARISMVEQLFRLQHKALEKKVREKLRHLNAMESEKSPRWVEKRMRKVRMRAEAEHAEIERQMAESKALHARRKLRLSEMEHQVYSLRSSTLKLKKRSQSADPQEKRGQNVDDSIRSMVKAATEGFRSARTFGNDSPFSSGYSTPTSTASSMKMLPPLSSMVAPPVRGSTIAATATASSLGRQHPSSSSSASSPSLLSHASPSVPVASGNAGILVPPGKGGNADSKSVVRPAEREREREREAVAGDHTLATARSSATERGTARSSATERGNITERSSATARSNTSERSSTGDAADGASRADTSKKIAHPSVRHQQAQQSGTISRNADRASTEKAAPQTSHAVSAGSSASAPLSSSEETLTSNKVTDSRRSNREDTESHADVGKSGERTINSQLRSLQRDMEATRVEIQGARNLKEKEAKLRILQRQKETAKRLYEQKQALVDERVRLIKLEREEQEVNELLDKALKLNVDEEVERKINETAAESSHLTEKAQVSPGGAAKKVDDAVGAERPPDWEARESHLERLREQVEEKKRAVERLHAERQKERQAREEQRLLKELRRVEEEAEQLKQKPSDSDEENSTASHAHASAARDSSAPSLNKSARDSDSQTANIRLGVGSTIPDAVATSDFVRDSKRNRPFNQPLGSIGDATSSDDGRLGFSTVEISTTAEQGVTRTEADLKQGVQSAVLDSMAAIVDTSPTSLIANSDSEATPGVLADAEAESVADDLLATAALQQQSLHIISGDAQLQPTSCDASTNSSEIAFLEEEIEVCEGDSGLSVAEWCLVVGDRRTANSCIDGSGTVTSQSGVVDDADVEPSAGERGNVLSLSARRASSNGMTLSSSSREMNDDTAAAAHAAEPLLRAPTPIAPIAVAAAGIADLLIEDGASSAGSDNKRAVGAGVVGEEIGSSCASDDGGSVSPVSSADHLAPESSDADGPPPRPPSPPPDNLRTMGSAPRPLAGATMVGASAPSAEALSVKAGQKLVATPQGDVDHITGEVLEMLLGEICTELDEIRGAHGSCRLTEKRRSRTQNNEVSQPSTHSGLVTPASHAVSRASAIAADVRRLPDAAAVMPVIFELLDVKDESESVMLPLPPLDEWKPKVVEAMLTRFGETDDSESERAVASRTRLLVDAAVEIAMEEVKPKPRLLGWNRPGFGEHPLSKFQEQQGAGTSQLRSWAEVRTYVEEALKASTQTSDVRAPDGEGDAAAGGAVAVTVAATDELAGGQATSPANVEECIDALLDEEIYRDEASWLDIGRDVTKVQSQIVQLIFADLVEEVAAEINCIWNT